METIALLDLALVPQLPKTCTERSAVEAQVSVKGSAVKTFGSQVIT